MALYIPIIFPDYSDAVSSTGNERVTAPLGHAGAIVVNSNGVATYYEWGFYNSSANGVVSTNGTSGNIRKQALEQLRPTVNATKNA